MPNFDRLHGAYGPGTIVRRTVRTSALPAGVDDGQQAQLLPLDSVLSREQFEELVERVADRIEERVILELQRRGRYGVTEVF